MAYFFRMILKRLAYAISGLLISFLLIQFNIAYSAEEYRAPRTGLYFSTIQSACNNQVSQWNIENGGAWAYNSHTTTDNIYFQCVYRRPSDGQINILSSSFKVQLMTCSVGKYWDSTTHSCKNEPICTPPQVLNSSGNACIDPPNPCDSKENQTVAFFSHIASGVGCVNGCEAFVASGTCGLNNAGEQGCFYVGTISGDTCTASETPAPDNSPEYDCVKQGKSYGTVNGVTVCVKNGTAGTPPLTTVDNGQKSVTNANGTTSSTTTTTTNNNTVTTTTTITNPDGSTSQESKEQDKPGFCEENPNSKICKDDEQSTFGGGCSGGPGSFSCEGDAIQCAIAKRIHQNDCEFKATEQTLKANSTYATGDRLLNGEYDTDVQNFIDGTGDSVRDVGVGNLSESGPIGFSGEGIEDVSFTAMGKTVTLPLSNFNKYLEYMGAILLALAYLGAFRIVMGGF